MTKLFVASLLRSKLVSTILVSRSGSERSEHGIRSSPMMTTGLHVVELEQRGAFEPTAFPSEIDALRDEAVGLAAEPLVVAGRDALARDDTSTVRRILAALEELADTGPWAAIAQHDIASPDT